MLLLVQLISEFPDASSPDPSLAMVGSVGHTFDMPGKHDTVSYWVDLPHCQALRTFDMEDRSHLHLVGQQVDLPRKSASCCCAERQSARFPNGIASKTTLAHACFGRFGGNLRQRQRL